MGGTAGEAGGNEGCRASVPRLTRMRPPVVKRQTTPRSGLLLFFRRVGLGAVGIRFRALTSCPSMRYRRPVSAPHTYGGSLACEAATARDQGWSCATSKPLGALVPASSKKRLSGSRSPVRRRCGGGAAHVQQTRPSSGMEAPERASHQRAGIRETGLWADVRSTPPLLSPARACAAGCSQRRPVRRQAHACRALTR